MEAVSSMKLNKTSLKLKNGSSYTLKKSIAPSNASNKTVTWTSSNKKAAAVSSGGKITAKGVGKATITAKTSNGKKAVCKVTVGRTKLKSLKNREGKALRLPGQKLAVLQNIRFICQKRNLPDIKG